MEKTGEKITTTRGGKEKRVVEKMTSSRTQVVAESRRVGDAGGRKITSGLLEKS